MRAAWLFACVLAACTHAQAPQTTVAASAPVASAGAPAASGELSATGAPITSAAASASADATRDARIRAKFGGHCRFERACGALWGIDCDAAVDGPYYYVKADSLDTVSECGGFCRGGRCTTCPPQTWTCAAY